MDTRIPHLLRVIREETELYRELVEHARRKTVLLIEGRLEPIMESNKVDETFAIKLRILENEAERLGRELGQVFGIARADFSLAALARSVGEPGASQMEAHSAPLRGLVRELEQVNRQNAKLLESSMRYSRVVADFLSNLSGSYRGTGLLSPLAAAPPTISRQA